MKLHATILVTGFIPYFACETIGTIDPRPNWRLLRHSLLALTLSEEHWGSDLPPPTARVRRAQASPSP